MKAKYSPLTIIAAFAAVSIAGGGLIFARSRMPPKQVSSASDDDSAPVRLGDKPRPRDLGPIRQPPERAVTTANAANSAAPAIESSEPSAKVLRPVIAADDPVQQTANATSPFAGDTERTNTPPQETPAAAAPDAPTQPTNATTQAQTPRAPAVPWDYNALPVFVPVVEGNPLGTPGTSTVGTAGTSTLGTSGTKMLGTPGTSTLGTSGTSTVGTNTTRAIVPGQPQR